MDSQGRVGRVSVGLLAPPMIREAGGKEAPMIDHSPRPGKIQPGTLFLRTAGAWELDPGHLLEVFGEQRQRFHHGPPGIWS